MLESVAISLCLFISLLAGLEFGRWLRLRRGPVQGDAGASSEADGVVFAMLGLMIAFTFTAAASRFEERQKLIAQQANALGTAWLRVDLLLEADREPVRKYMREWLKLEVEVTPLVANDPVQFDAHLRAAAHLQDQAWSAVVAAIDRHPKPPYAGVVIPPFNDWIDLTSARVELGNRGVPPMVMPTLGLLSITAAVLAGFSMGKRPQRSLMHMLLFSGAITLAIFVIIDLNHPRSGLIRVDSADHAMQELYATMTAAAPTTGEVKP